MAGSGTQGFFADDETTVADLVTVLDADLYPDGLQQGYVTDACIDLAVSRESAWLHAHETYQAGLGVRVDVPEGYVGLVVPRSSTAHSGVQVPIVALDPGYEGEIHTWLTSPTPTRYSRGDVLVGLMVVPCLAPGATPRKVGERGDGNLASSERDS
jgi:deoxycytidine triphosphate deaminase